MNVMKAVTTAAPRPERAAERAIERTTRPDGERTETEATTETETKRSVSRARKSLCWRSLMRCKTTAAWRYWRLSNSKFAMTS